MNTYQNNYTDKIIIWQPWGGLGDNLQFTTLPEMAHEAGLKCYISNNNTYRNNEIKQLVWDTNPHIDGYTDEHQNAGIADEITPDGSMQKLKKAKEILNVDNNIYLYEYIHGFNPKNKIPKLYYKPKIIKEVKNLNLIDLGIISLFGHYNINNLKQTIKQLYDIKNMYTLKSKTITSTGYIIADIPHLYFNNIFEYCDLIFSCKKFICLASGTNPLAAALLGNTEKQADILVAPNMPGIMTGANAWKYDVNNYIFI